MKTNAEINLEVNGRGLGDLNDEIEQAFDTARVDDFTNSTEEATDSLREAGGEARKLDDSIGDVNAEFDRFKQAGRTIRDVRQETDRLNRSLRETVRLLDRTRRSGGPGGGGPGGGGGGPGGGGGGDVGAQRLGPFKQMLAGIPFVAAAAGFLTLGGQAYSSYINRERARRDAFAARQTALTGEAISAGAIEDKGVAFGYAPAESQQMYAQFMARAGAPIDAAVFERALAARQTYGVDLSEAGAQIQAFRRAAGDTEGLGFEDTLRRAVALGLDGSELSTYMQSQTQLIQRQAEIGATQLDMTGFRAIEAQLAQIVGGFRAQRMTNVFASGVSDIGYQGAGGATEFILAQQAGYEPGMGVDAYFEALLQMQDIGSNPELMPGYLSRFVNDEAGDATNIAMLQRAYSAATGGERLHADLALAYLRGDTSAIQTSTPATLDAGAFDVSGATGVSGALVGEAGLEARRAGLGGQFAQTFLELGNVSLEVTEAFTALAPVVTELARLAGGAMGQLNDLIDRAPELWATLQRAFTNLERVARRWGIL